ncbi:MAG: hypothetical protein AB7U62_00960 [Pseudolabrys sp.]
MARAVFGFFFFALGREAAARGLALRVFVLVDFEDLVDVEREAGRRLAVFFAGLRMQKD